MPGAYVAGDQHGALRKSDDGSSWTSTGSISQTFITCIAYGNGLWMAAGHRVVPPYHGVILYSQDAASWTQAMATADDPSEDIRDIAWNGSWWTAVSNVGEVFSSFDGITWTQGTTGIENNGYLYSVLPGQVVLVAGYSLDTGAVAMFGSLDGLNWNPWSGPTGWTGAPVGAFGTNYVVVSTDEGKAHSDDAVNWTIDSTNGADIARYGGSLYVALGIPDSSYDTFVATSSDGVTWSDGTIDPVGYIRAYTYGTAGWVGFAKNFDLSTESIFTSPDGLSWSSATAPFVDATSVAFGDIPVTFTADAVISAPAATSFTADAYVITSLVYHVAVGDHNTGTAWVSRSAAAGPNSSSPWTTTDLDTSTSGFWDVAYLNGKWISVTDERSIYISTDGVTWSQVANVFPSGYSPTMLAAGGTLFLALGYDGVYYSTDAVTWSQGRAYDSDDLINGIYWDGTQFILYGSHRVAFTDIRPFLSTSANGTSWTDYVGPTGTAGYRSFDSIAFDGVTWVANVSTSTIVRQIGTATSLSSWTISSFTTSGSLLAVAYGNGYFAFGHTNGNVYYSTTATGWNTSNAVTVVRGDIIEYSGIWLLSNGQDIYASGASPVGPWLKVFDQGSDSDIYAIATGLASQLTRHFTADAVFARTATGNSFGADAILEKARFAANAVLFKTHAPVSFTADAITAYFKPSDIDPTLDIRRNRHDRNDAHFGTWTADQAFHDDTTLLEDAIRDLWTRITDYENSSH